MTKGSTTESAKLGSSRAAALKAAMIIGAGFSVALALVQATAPRLKAQVARRALTLDLDSAKVTGGRLPFDERFDLWGKASRDLVQVTVLLRAIPRPCPQPNLGGPPDSATWTRSDSRAVFSLTLGPICADQEYSMRVRTLTAQPDSVNARIRRNAAAAVVDVVRSFFAANAQRPTDETRLQELRAKLLAALPKGDSMYYRDTSGTYLPYDSTRLANRIAADAALGTLYSALEQLYLNSVETAVDNFRLHADRLADALGHLGAALRTAHIDLVLAGPDSGRADRRLAAAASIARLLPNYDPRERTLIADGATPLGAPDINATDTPIQTARSGADLSPALARLDTLELQLRDLEELAALFGEAKTGGPPVTEVVAADRAARDILFQLAADGGLLAGNLDAMARAADGLVGSVSTYSVANIGVLGSAATNYVDRAKDYISADLGIVSAVGLFNRFAGGATQGYVGASFSFVPVNKEAPYGPLCLRFSVWKCLSLTVGLTTGSIARSTVRTDLFGSHSLYAAIGVRISGYVRASMGSLIFQSYTADARHVARVSATFAFGVSIDWDVKSTLGGLGDALSGK